MKHIFLISFLALAFVSRAQTNKKTDVCKEVENTYQIINLQPRYNLAITVEVCEIVKRERRKEETFIYPVNEFYSIKIYSEKDIPKLKQPIELVIKAEN